MLTCHWTVQKSGSQKHWSLDLQNFFQWLAPYVSRCHISRLHSWIVHRLACPIIHFQISCFWWKLKNTCAARSSYTKNYLNCVLNNKKKIFWYCSHSVLTYSLTFHKLPVGIGSNYCCCNRYKWINIAWWWCSTIQQLKQSGHRKPNTPIRLVQNHINCCYASTRLPAQLMMFNWLPKYC